MGLPTLTTVHKFITNTVDSFRNSSDTDVTFVPLRDLPGFKGILPYPVFSPGVPIKAYARYLEDTMNWLQDNFVQYNGIPVPFFVYFLSQPKFGTAAGTYKTYNEDTDTYSYPDNTVANVFKLPYDRNAGKFNCELSQTAKIADSADSLTLFDLYFHDINTYLNLYIDYAPFATVVGSGRATNYPFLNRSTFPIGDSVTLNVKNATSAKIKVGTLVSFVGHDTVAPYCPLVQPANAKNNQKALGIVASALDPYSTDESKIKAILIGHTKAELRYIKDYSDTITFTDLNGFFDNTDDDRLELFNQLANYPDGTILYLSTTDGKLTDTPDPNYLIQPIGQRSISGYLTPPGQGTYSVDQRYDTAFSFQYYNALFNQQKVSLDNGISERQLALLRPTAPCTVATKDGHLLFVDLLRAKKLKKVDDTCYLGKYAPLDLDGNRFYFDSHVSLTNNIFFYSKGDTGTTSTKVLCTGHCLFPRCNQITVGDSIKDLATNVYQVSYNTGAGIFQSNEHVFLYKGSDDLATIWGPTKKVGKRYIEDINLNVFQDNRNITITRNAGLGMFSYNALDFINTTSYNFLTETYTETQFPTIYPNIRVKTTIFGATYRSLYNDVTVQRVLSTSLGGFPESIYRIYSSTNAGVITAFVLGTSGKLYSSKTFYALGQLPLFQDYANGGNDPFAHAPLYQQKGLGVYNDGTQSNFAEYYSSDAGAHGYIGESIINVDGSNDGTSIYVQRSYAYDFHPLCSFGDDEITQVPDMCINIEPYILMINHLYSKNDAFLGLYEPNPFCYINPSGVTQKDVLFALPTTPTKATSSFPRHFGMAQYGHVQLVIPGTRFNSDTEYNDFMNLPNKTPFKSIGLVSHGCSPITNDDNTQSHIQWNIESGPFENTLVADSIEDHRATLGVINNHSPFYVTVKDGYKQYVSEKCKKHRISRLRIKVWPLTLPKSFAKTGLDTCFQLYGNWYMQAISPLNNIVDHTDKDGYTYYKDGNNLGDSISVGNFTLTRPNGPLYTDENARLSSPQTQIVFGKKVGSSQLKISRWNDGGNSTINIPTNTVDQTYTVEIWDVQTSSGDIPKKMTFDPSNSANNIVKIYITGNSSYPHTWRSTNPGVAEVIYDPDVSPQDTRKAQISIKGPGQFMVVAMDSAEYPWRSDLITVSNPS